MRLPATFHCITGFLAGVSTNKIHPVPLSRSPGILAEIPVHNKEGLELCPTALQAEEETGAKTH